MKDIYIEIIEAKASRTFIRAYFLFGHERISINIKLILHEVLIRLIKT
jgi:hypothetical protein